MSVQSGIFVQLFEFMKTSVSLGSVFSALVVTVLSTVLLIIYYLQFSPYARTRKIVDKIPGPPALPLVGNALMFKPGGADFMEQVIQFTKDFNIDEQRICRIWLGTQPIVLMYGAQSVEALLSSAKHITKAKEYDFLHPWLATGLLTSTGDKWRMRRKLLTPTFHFKILNDFLQVFNEQSNIFIDKLMDQADGQTFDIFPMITACALDIICETAMGKNVNAQQDSDTQYVKAVYKISEVVQQRQKQPWLWPNWVFRLTSAGKEHDHCLSVLHGFTEKVIMERMVAFKEFIESEQMQKTGDEELADRLSKKRRLAFLDMLLFAAKEGADIQFYGIREEVDTFMFEGHDTTAAAMAWAVHLLGVHTDVQKKVHDELDNVLGEGNDPITMEDIRKMTWLECVIKEALRLFPSVPMFGRMIAEDCVLGGYDIPKGTTALVVTSALHRDATHFPDPDEFRPERWLPQNVVGRHPFCYVPFSAGLRNCIGQKFALNEEKVILSNLFRRFTIESCDKTENLRPIGELILRPGVGVKVSLTARS